MSDPRPRRIPATPHPTSTQLVKPAPDPPPGCAFADEVSKPGPRDDWTLAVLDTALRLPTGYAPDDLVPVSRAGLAGGGHVRELILSDLAALKAAADAAGVPLRVRSAYRSEARQHSVFHDWVRSVGLEAAQQSSARPGHSEHQLGTTLDLAGGAQAPWIGDFGSAPTGRWLAAHAAEFGFVISYPADETATTCYAAEPWHVRWIGRAPAAELVASGRTLREWLWALR